MDSNHRRRKPADLQSAPFGHSGNFPFLASSPPLEELARFTRPFPFSKGIDFAPLHLRYTPLVFPFLGRLSSRRCLSLRNPSSLRDFRSQNNLPSQTSLIVKFFFRTLPAADVFFAPPCVGCPSRWRDSNPRPADYKSAALAN